MVLDFDVKLFCDNLRATKPPYECPISGCGKVYKTYAGIQFHLHNYDHENPDTMAAGNNATGSPSGDKWHHRQLRRLSTPTQSDILRSPVRAEAVPRGDDQRIVEVNFGGKIHRVNIFDPIELIIRENPVTVCSSNRNEEVKRTEEDVSAFVEKDANASNLPPSTIVVELPKADFKILENYARPPKAPPQPTTYYRFTEKTSKELDEEVEYDMDEEVGKQYLHSPKNHKRPIEV